MIEANAIQCSFVSDLEYLNNKTINRNVYNIKGLTIPFIKELGKNKSLENLKYLIELYSNDNVSLDLKREIVSSIGRQNDDNIIVNFIKQSYKLSSNSMDMIYQMYRTCLINYDKESYNKLSHEIEEYYQNEYMDKMKKFYLYRKSKNKFKPTEADIKEPSLLIGDSKDTLSLVKEKSVKLIFTSPPYYNAKEYSVYKSYADYLSQMKDVLLQCYKVLEDGRFIIINVSPVITKRAGREYESIRYPIHFDFHKILTDCGFEFIDEIIWQKPKYSVPNRNGGYVQTHMPLSYKPNCVTESIMVYRKQCSFLLDKNISCYNFSPNLNENFDETNCWLIQPKSSKEHPAIFPKELCEKILKYYSFPNDLVLDPFAGSGTFGEVSKMMNRIPLLCEKYEKYVEILKKKKYKVLNDV